MAFNWFNRFNQPKAEADVSEATQPDASTSDAEPIEAVEDPEQAKQAAIERARIALEAIKQRKQQEAAPVPPAESDQADSIQEDVEQPSEPVSEPTITAEETVALTPETIAEEPTPAVLSDQADVLEDSAAPASQPLETQIDKATTEPEPPVTQNVPLWAQAEAEERAARLERLRATAIAEEPDVTASPQTNAALVEESDSGIPLTLDEGFLWSTEVLSAMGRRAQDITLEEITWLKRLRQGLDKTRRSLVNQLKAIVGQGPLNEDAVLEIESLLLQADAGVEATDRVIQALQSRLREETLPPEQALAYLKQILRELLDRPLQGSHSVFFAPEKDTLNIWLMTGVNGAGKTTTIGKLAHIAQKSGYLCLIAAADTFRAAAVEQVKVWGQRSNVEVIANPGQNTDPAAVVFDGIAAAQSRGTELLLIDTAGRLQNKKNLMDELNKIRRIIDKKATNAKVESLLVLDATLGQNGLQQAKVFAEAAQLSGVVLTKLDGTAKGGIALAVVEQLGLPIRFIGAGEGIEDLRPFSSYEFVEALISG
ncbi:MAG: signal recognition particle-docking protein FtsY [Myxacorys californica WJT36-NPBG1]|jgi:fused signal recognition particle receptor|nr:signal recognition particle-docking protein FtsY [Myxacorys californica WJT36-NPBG1]